MIECNHGYTTSIYDHRTNEEITVCEECGKHIKTESMSQEKYTRCPYCEAKNEAETLGIICDCGATGTYNNEGMCYVWDKSGFYKTGKILQRFD